MLRLHLDSHHLFLEDSIHWVVIAPTEWRANRKYIQCWSALGCSDMTECLKWLLPDCFSNTLKGICNRPISHFTLHFYLWFHHSLGIVDQLIWWRDKRTVAPLYELLYIISIGKMRDQSSAVGVYMKELNNWQVKWNLNLLLVIFPRLFSQNILS